MIVHFEKRSVQRIHVELPLTHKHGVGITRDFSRAGIYFIADILFCTPGECMEFSFEVKNALPGKTANFAFLGQVLRIEELNTGYGVAATIENIACLN